MCVYACNVFLVLFSVLFYSFFFFACFSKERESEKEGIKLDGGREDLEGYEGEAMTGIYCINITIKEVLFQILDRCLICNNDIIHAVRG